MEAKSNLQKAFEKVNKLDLTDTTIKPELLNIMLELSSLQYQKGMDDTSEIYNKNR